MIVSTRPRWSQGYGANRWSHHARKRHAAVLISRQERATWGRTAGKYSGQTNPRALGLGLGSHRSRGPHKVNHVHCYPTTSGIG